MNHIALDFKEISQACSVNMTLLCKRRKVVLLEFKPIVKGEYPILKSSRSVTTTQGENDSLNEG
jgi:hypothetical protein